MLPLCARCHLKIEYSPKFHDGKYYHLHCLNPAIKKETQMSTKKITLLEKISKNKKIIIKRTLQIGAGIAGVLVLSSLLSKKAFLDEEEPLEIEDGYSEPEEEEDVQEDED